MEASCVSALEKLSLRYWNLNKFLVNQILDSLKILMKYLAASWIIGRISLTYLGVLVTLMSDLYFRARLVC